MIGKNGNQLEDFLRKVEFDHSFSHHSTVPTDVYTELTKARGKQIFVYKIWKPTYATTLSQFQSNDMIFQISYVNQQGDVETEKIAVTGKTLHSVLCARNGATKMSYLYDGTNRRISESDNEYTTNEIQQGTIQGNSFSQIDNQNNSLDMNQTNVMQFSQNNIVQTNIMTPTNIQNHFFPDMNLFTRMYNPE